MAIVYLGLGSNLGDRRKNISGAMARLRKCGIDVLKTSAIIETKPAGGPPQGKYLNAVSKVQTDLKPLDLLQTLRDIEKKMGRIKTVVNGPRPIDIDILLYDRMKINTEQLTIPHPRMFERDFVIKPLLEIEPDILKRIPHEDHPES